MQKPILAISVLCLAAQAASPADFQYQETTQMTGGSALAAMKMAGTFSKAARQATDPTVSSVYIQGNRMARVSPLSTEIIDLDNRTITNIDHSRKQYTVMTFEQLKRQMELAAARMQSEQAKQKPSSLPNDTRMDFAVKVRETGAEKDISGVPAKEAILNLTLTASSTKSSDTGALAMTNDMWMAADIPGYAAVRAFYTRYSAEMGAMVGESVSRSMAAMPAGMGEGMAAMMKEVSRLKGVPILQIMRIGTSINGEPLPAASEAPLPDSGGSTPSGSDVAKSVGSAAAASALKGLAGGLGGFGGFGRSKKPKEDAPTAGSGVAPGAAGATGYAVLMENRTEITGFSSAAIDPSKFQHPAGYKQIVIQDK
ncbi:MAG: hypothetical protein ABJC09_14435 [Terriglobia bacterium]